MALERREEQVGSTNGLQNAPNPFAIFFVKVLGSFEHQMFLI